MLFEYVLEIEHGSRRDSRREFVDAPDRAAAKRYAHTAAAKLYSDARHDRELDVFVTPDGVTQWTVARVAPVSVMPVAVADEHGGNGKIVHVALVPCRDVATPLGTGVRVLRMLCAGTPPPTIAMFKSDLGLSDAALSADAGALERVAAQMRDA